MELSELRIGGWYKSKDDYGKTFIFKLVGKLVDGNGEFYKIKTRHFSLTTNLSPSSGILKNAVPYEDEAEIRQTMKTLMEED